MELADRLGVSSRSVSREGRELAVRARGPVGPSGLVSGDEVETPAETKLDWRLGVASRCPGLPTRRSRVPGQVFAFKAPTSEELDHDFLWRTSKSLPERGRIGIFNRSYYEEVLVVKVHEAILQKQKLPKQVISRRIWEERYEDIRTFERYLARQGYLILKFFLHVSKKAQKERFLERLDRPEKNWKFSLADAQERGHWGAYARAYEDMIRATAAPHAPWYVVPADKKWFTRLVVAAAVHEALDRLDLAYPKVDEAKKKELLAARAALDGAREGKAK